MGLAALAGSQATFWGIAAYASQTAPEPLVGGAWTVGGFGLSAAFVGLIVTYLRRSVAEVAVMDGAGGIKVRVTTHGFGREEVIPAREIVGGVGGREERYWTFARKGEGLRLFYIVDMEYGARDLEGVKAVVGGGDMLMALAHKRNAGRMRRRWEEWKEGTHG